MRQALAALTTLLLATPALAQDLEAARATYVQCFVENSDKLMANWCHDPDKLADFASQACLRDALGIVQAAQRARRTDGKQQVASAEVDGQLAMLGRLQTYNNGGKCTR